jgi:hypothetical protein
MLPTGVEFIDENSVAPAGVAYESRDREVRSLTWPMEVFLRPVSSQKDVLRALGGGSLASKLPAKIAELGVASAPKLST